MPISTSRSRSVYLQQQHHHHHQGWRGVGGWEGRGRCAHDWGDERTHTHLRAGSLRMVLGLRLSRLTPGFSRSSSSLHGGYVWGGGGYGKRGAEGGGAGCEKGDRGVEWARGVGGAGQQPRSPLDAAGRHDVAHPLPLAHGVCAISAWADAWRMQPARCEQVGRRARRRVGCWRRVPPPVRVPPERKPAAPPTNPPTPPTHTTHPHHPPAKISLSRDDSAPAGSRMVVPGAAAVGLTSWFSLTSWS